MCYTVDMRLTYKYRLFPTSAQRTSLERTLEICRLVYNDTLAIRKETYEQTGNHLSMYETHNLLPGWKIAKPFYAEVYAQVLQNVQQRVDIVFQGFFRRVKAGEDKVGYPRFKGKGNYDSFTYKQRGFWITDDRLTLSKIGDIRVKLHRPIVGEIKTLTIRRDTVGNFFACFSCEVEPLPLPVNDNVVGIDLGLTTFAHFSNGKKIERQRWMKQDEQDIARLQRKKEKFAKDSPEYRKVVHALRHAYRRAANRRNNFAHQESRKLVNEYQFIAFEKLDIENLKVSGNNTIGNGINDVAWGYFVRFSTYKAESAGRGVALVNPRGTTQMCSGCGVIVPKDLSVRVHDCPNCGLKLSRDHNAALNILARGLSSLSADSSVVAVEACG